MCVCVTLGLLVSPVSTSLVSTQLISTQLISTHESKTLYFLEESSNNCIFHQESWPTGAKHVLFPVETTTSAFRRTPLRGPSSRPQRNEVAIRLAISNFFRLSWETSTPRSNPRGASDSGHTLWKRSWRWCLHPHLTRSLLFTTKIKKTLVRGGE